MNCGRETVEQGIVVVQQLLHHCDFGTAQHNLDGSALEGVDDPLHHRVRLCLPIAVLQVVVFIQDDDDWRRNVCKEAEEVGKGLKMAVRVAEDHNILLDNGVEIDLCALLGALVVDGLPLP